MPSLGSLYVELSANTAKFTGPLSAAARSAKSAANDISKEFSSLQRLASQTFGAFGQFNPVISQLAFGLSTMGRAAADAIGSFGKISSAAAALGALGSGAAAGGAILDASLLAIAMHASESAAKMFELAQSTGVSVEALSGLSLVAKQNGVSAESMVTGLERMSRSAFAAATAPVGAINAYTRLGISVKDSAGNMRPTEQLFEDISTRFAAMADGGAKTALAIQLFGRSGADLIPVLNQGGAGIQELLALFQKLGGILSGEVAEKAEKFQQTLGLLSIAADGASNQFLAELLPALQALAGALLRTAEDGHTALEDLTHDVAEFVKVSLGALSGAVHGVEEFAIAIESIGESIANPLAALTDFWSKSKKNWQDNADFINSLTFHPNFTLTPSSPTGPQGGGFTAGEDYLKRTQPPGGGPDLDNADGAAKKFASALAELNAKYDEQANAAGLAAGAIEDYRLRTLAAAAGDRAAAEAGIAKLDVLRKYAEYQQEQAKLKGFPAAGTPAPTDLNPNAFLPNPYGAHLAEAPGLAKPLTSSLTTLADTYAGTSAAGAKWVENLDAQRAAAVAAVDALDPLKSGLASIDLSVLAPKPAKTPQQNAVEQLQQRDLRVQTRAGKGYGFSEDIDQLEELKAELQGTGESTLLLDAAIYSEGQRMTQVWDAAAEKVGTLGERYKALLDEIQRTGANPLGETFNELGRSLDSLSDTLARFIVTGKNGFKQWAEQLGEGVLKTQIQSAFSGLAGVALKLSTPGAKSSEAEAAGIPDVGSALNAGPAKPVSGIEAAIAKAFGVRVPGGKGTTPRGDTPGNALYVTIVGGQAGASGSTAGVLGSLPGTPGGPDSAIGVLSQLGKPGSPTTPPFLSPSLATSLGSLFTSKSSQSGLPDGIPDVGSALAKGPAAPGGAGLGSIFKTLGSGASGIGGVIGGLAGKTTGLFGKFFSMFGGFLAEGGDVTPGRAYMVGEKHPEFFVPKQAGQVTPSLKTGGGSARMNTVHMHFHGVKDADSFRHSSSQIYAHMHAQLARANSRNG